MRAFRLSALVATWILWAGLARAAGPLHVVLLGVGANDPSAANSARAAETAVRQMLAGRFTLVPGNVYKSKAKELGATSANPSDVKKVCTAIGSDAIVAGSLASEEDTWELRLAVRRCDTGEAVEKFRYPLTSPDVDFNTLKKVEGDLATAFAGMGGSSETAAPAPTGPAPENETAPVAEGSGSPEEGATPSDAEAGPGDVASENPLEQDANVGDGGDGTGETVTEAAPGARRTGVVDVAAGLDMGQRTFQFASPARQWFKGAMTPGLFADAAAYPFAAIATLADRKALSGLGLGLTLDYVPDYVTSGGPTNLQSFEQTWSIGLRYHYALGDADTSALLRFAVGYEDREFLLSQHGAGIAVPSIEYRNVELRGGVLVPLLAGRLHVGADVGLLPAAGAPNLGGPTMYGTPGGGSGFEASAGARFRFARYLEVRTDLRYLSLSSTYAAYGSASESHLDWDLLLAFLF